MEEIKVLKVYPKVREEAGRNLIVTSDFELVGLSHLGSNRLELLKVHLCPLVLLAVGRLHDRLQQLLLLLHLRELLQVRDRRRVQ